MTTALDLTRLADPDALSDAELETLVAAGLETLERSVQDWPIAYHTCRNPMARPLHRSIAREVAVLGGNRSSKTSEMLAELAIQLTNCVPYDLRDVYPRAKLRGPIRARVICNSLTDVLEPIIKPKLRYTDWNGIGDPVDGRGHWGWIPRQLLRHSQWDRAYSEKYRTLHVAVDSSHLTGGVLLELRQWSSCQFCSYDQDLSALAGTSMHVICHDELSPADVYRESRMRTLDVKGQIVTAFTPPDEAGARRGDVAWFYDEVYTRGLPGPEKAPDVDTVTLFTEANSILDPAEVAALAAKLTPEQQAVRLYGRFLHLSGLVFPRYADQPSRWCLRCQDRLPGFSLTCPRCGADDLPEVCHVVDPYPIPTTWPVVCVMDPHPRKPAAVGYFAVTPTDDLVQCGEVLAAGTAGMVVAALRDYERGTGWRLAKRLMDPKMASQGNNLQEEAYTNREGFDRAGMHFDLADNRMSAGIEAVEDYLRVDPLTRRPRLTVFRTCARTRYSLTHWTWADWARTGDREPKEVVSERHKDFADVVRYAANTHLTYQGLVRNIYELASRAARAGRPSRGY